MSRSFYHHLTLTGTVVLMNNDGANFLLRTRSGDEFYVYVTDQTYFKTLKNLDEQAEASRDRYAAPPSGKVPDATDSPAWKIRKYLNEGALVTIEGVISVNELKRRVDARTVHLLYQQDDQWIGEKLGKFAWEGSHWWLSQLTGLADGWLRALWPNQSQNYDFDSYLTNLDLAFRPTDNKVQESATLSRLIFGLSSAFMLTGCVRYYDAASAGVEFLRKNFKSTASDGEVVFWASKRIKGVMMIESANPDDKNSVPLYEQIYCLAGLTQFYRITQDWGVLDDIMKTVNGFQLYFHDKSEHKGWFSHLDYATLSPHSPCLGENASRKNWNSIGDHLPAYLLNLLLALDPLPEKYASSEHMNKFVKTCKDMLKEASNLIADKFLEKIPNPDSNSDEYLTYVQERYFADWTPDKAHSWQQNRAIIGHNLKIAWNLTRVANYFDAENANTEHNKDKVDTKSFIDVAERLANKMVEVGAVDLFRGGCFDAVERLPANGQSIDFTWLNTKDFWQQEQGILAYYILYGRTKNAQYLDYARDMTSFWNIFFLDQDNKASYFRTTDDGLPVIKDGYGAKAGHAIAGYHAFELNFLAHIYISAYVTTKPFCLYFMPKLNSINVLPDGFPTATGLKIHSATSNGVVLNPVNISNFTVKLPVDDSTLGAGHTLRVQFKPIHHCLSREFHTGESSRNLLQSIQKLQKTPDESGKKGKIGVIVESHFDEGEVREFNKVFPSEGYEVQYLSHLWKQPFAYYTGNDHNDPLYVFTELDTLSDEDLLSYKGFIFVGGYATDRLRYQIDADVRPGNPNQSPTVKFLRRIVKIPQMKIGTICHSLWIFCAAKETIEGRTVTCANNILCDVLNAGGIIEYKAGGAGGMVPVYVDRKEGAATLISGQHPNVVTQFVKTFLEEINEKLVN